MWTCQASVYEKTLVRQNGRLHTGTQSRLCVVRGARFWVWTDGAIIRLLPSCVSIDLLSPSYESDSGQTHARVRGSQEYAEVLLRRYARL
jgi:hypothetical protein